MADLQCVVVRPLYSGGVWEDLPGVREGAAALVKGLRTDVTVKVEELSPAGDVSGSAVVDWVHDQIADDEGPVLVYMGGHGVVSRRSHYTALDQTPLNSALPRTAVWSSQLCETVAGRGRDVVLFLDSCFAGEAAIEGSRVAATALASPGSGGRFGLVASCRAVHGDGSIPDGALLETLVALMTDGPVADDQRWGPGDERIRLGALVEELKAAGLPVVDALLAGAGELRVVPNFGYEPSRGAGRVHVRVALRRLSRGAETHLMDKSDVFVGRRQVRAEVVKWLGSDRQGLFVITGSLGTGKSALVGLLARQSIGDTWATELDDAPAVARDTFAAIVHVRQKTLSTVRAELEPLLGTEAPERATVLVDALDEAVAGEAVSIAAYLASLAKQLGLRVVVGTRPGPVIAGAGRHDPLLYELRTGCDDLEVVDLDGVDETVEDIAALVRTSLLSIPGRPYTAETASLVARAVAEDTTPNFLFAHAASRWLTSQTMPIVGQGSWRRRIRAWVGDVTLERLVEDDLAARYHGADLDRVRDLLRALAWAEGLGIPRYTIWPTFAEALSSNSTRYGDADVTWVLNEAGWYITEASEDGQSVYRLFHQSLVDYFRRTTPQ